MVDLNRVALCLQKIKSKNLGQNQDNLKNFLVKDYEYAQKDYELAQNLIDEAVQANIVKSIMFNGKTRKMTRKMKELMLIQSSWKKVQPT